MALKKRIKQGYVHHKPWSKLLPDAQKIVIAKCKESCTAFQCAIQDTVSDIQVKIEEIAMAHHKSVATVQSLLYTTMACKQQIKVNGWNAYLWAMGQKGSYIDALTIWQVSDLKLLL